MHYRFEVVTTLSMIEMGSLAVRIKNEGWCQNTELDLSRGIIRGDWNKLDGSLNGLCNNLISEEGVGKIYIEVVS
jgi:hypothetical protein